MILWYTESWIPLKMSEKWRNDKTLEHRGTKLIQFVQTLSDPVLLRRFERHVLKEWSPESLQFYKAVTVHQIYTKRALTAIKKEGKKDSPDFDKIETVTSGLLTGAMKIYLTYVDNRAPNMVNIDGKIRLKIVRFFSSPGMRSYRTAAENSGGSLHNFVFQRSRRRDRRSSMWYPMRQTSPSKHELSPSPRSPSPGKSDDAKSEASVRSISSPTIRTLSSQLESDTKSPKRSYKKMSIETTAPLYLTPEQFCKVVSEANLDHADMSIERTSRGRSDNKRERSGGKSPSFSGSVSYVRSIQANLGTSVGAIETLIGVYNIFSEAAREVFQLMEGDSHTRFTTRASVEQLATYTGAV
mmetsp:Transcript_5094/g.10095  ORF Transcript_5094/g.10095 Transcript_5094/m.10095 type:complete len:355 (-) Transcript_5094:663-1727(-)